MEAKDTVMGKVQRDNIFYHGIGTLEGVCTMQAEISFKAGQESEVAHSADLCAAYWDAIKEEGHKAGIKEVVGWLERTRKQKVPKYQLKEWGIE